MLYPPPPSWISLRSLTSSVLFLCASPGILWLRLLGKVGLGPHTLEGEGSGAADAVPLSARNPAGLIAWEELKGLEMQRTALLTFQLCPGAAGGHTAR